jgi:hypothetical protein
MFRATATYSNPEKTEKVFEIPLSTSLPEGLQEAKSLSNDYLSSLFPSQTPDPEPSKKKKSKSDSEEDPNS